MGLISFVKEKINKSELKRIEKITQEVLDLDELMKSKTDAQLREYTDKFKEEIKNGKTLDEILPEAFAVVREAAHRVIGLKPYPVQITGGIVLHQGRIAEMKTGEGKTLVAIMPLYLNSLEGKGAHLVTVNDYLADYQSRWMGKVFEFLGVSVGCIVNGLSSEEKQREYRKDVTYGTNNEFGFDYLRDNMEIYKENQRQRGFRFAIIDEVDSILIDEARTPLIISGRGEKSSDLYNKANGLAMLIKEEDVTIDEKEQSIFLNDENGIPKAERYFGIDNLSDPENMEISHHINQAIRAKFLKKKDVDYVVQDGQVVIVDEFTGRLMPGRRYSNGLHQAIEAKEGLKVKEESQTLATITLQNFFRMYDKLAGMTGTAKTEEEEFKEIYNMDVVQIPTNKPVIREDLNDLVYGKQEYKDKAIIEEIEKRHKNNQPILVGTISVEYSEKLSKLLKKKGIKHNVLNAKEHRRESEIVAQAGRYGAVTIATNMAGRGTDILLGGNVEFILREKMRKLGFEEDTITKALNPFSYDEEDVIACEKEIEKIKDKIEQEVREEAELVKKAGGLHVLGTERHESRRIDNQLRGRSGRQGDPGSSQFFISLEDDLCRTFMSESMTNLVLKLGMDKDVILENRTLTNGIERAQKRVENYNYSARKSVLGYDEILNQQRKFVFEQRTQVLNGESIKDNIFEMLKEYIERVISAHVVEDELTDHSLIKKELTNFFGYNEPVIQLSQDKTIDENIEDLFNAYKKIYEERESLVGVEKMRELERIVMLTSVDQNWILHMDDMENLRQGIGLRAIGQQNPMQAYQRESFDLYEQMLDRIKEDTLSNMFRINLSQERQRKRVSREERASKTNEDVRTYKSSKKKVNRNDLCPCGSGKKYKNCHMLMEDDPWKN